MTDFNNLDASDTLNAPIELVVGGYYRAQFEDGKNFFYKVTSFNDNEVLKFTADGFFRTWDDEKGPAMMVTYFLNQNGNWHDDMGHGVTTVEKLEQEVKV